MPTRVVIVDDSATMRSLVARILSADGRFEVVGTAADPYEAREVIKATNPDVLTLDVEMPRMDGLSFLEKIMRLRPMPVVMLSSLTHDGSAAAIDALALGAVDCIGKPGPGAADALDSLADRVHVAATARLPGARPAAPPRPAAAPYRWDGRVALVGASTGGVDALERLLGALPAAGPPILIAQHMPESFLVSFADRLAQRVLPTVALATDGAPVEPGRVYLAPGGSFHLGLGGSGRRLRCRMIEAPKCNGHRPSVDVLFRSALGHAERCVAVLLTGMGRDGAEGMAELHRAGATTLAQDRDSCVVYGMPRVAVDLGGVTASLPIEEIAARLLAVRPDGADGSRPA